jgi:sugar O-acyltransferase (sialic acid O-acetyltransferase NeuD family)
LNRSLLILGCGGHGRVVADAARACGYDRIAFLDDACDDMAVPPDLTVLGPFDALLDCAHDWPNAIAAIGDNAKRLDLFSRLARAGFHRPALVHPSAVISSGADIRDGVFIGALAAVNVGARIGEAVIVNTGARVDHDCEIGAASHIAPGATLSGGVTVGDRAWLGTGCSVRQNVKIGADTVVGVGAAVVSDLASGHTYVGVPARPLAGIPR